MGEKRAPGLSGVMLDLTGLEALTERTEEA